MKREIVVFSVIGGLMWMATGLSVLAVATIDGTSEGRRTQHGRVIDGTALDSAITEARARDAERLFSVCESTSAGSTQARLDLEPSRRPSGATITGAEDACRDRNAISLIRLCLLLT